MSGTFPAVCAARTAAGASTRKNVAMLRMHRAVVRLEILFTPIVMSLLFWRPFKSVRRRYRQFLLLTIRQRNLKKQTRRLPIQQRRTDDFYFVTGFDHVGPPASPLEHVYTRAFERVVLDDASFVDIDVEIGVRITPLPLRDGAFQIQSARVIV